MWSIFRVKKNGKLFKRPLLTGFPSKDAAWTTFNDLELYLNYRDTTTYKVVQTKQENL